MTPKVSYETKRKREKKGVSERDRLLSVVQYSSEHLSGTPLLDPQGGCRCSHSNIHLGDRGQFSSQLTSGPTDELTLEYFLVVGLDTSIHREFND